VVIPHPRMIHRRFVLQPLAEIRPQLTLPGDRVTISEHLRRLDSGEPELTLVQAQW
jgi:2-amino-4-hydroxy-6-hydroxymethyldihydropteridine diphosphokinase